MASSQSTPSDFNVTTVTSDVTSDVNNDTTIAPPSYESVCATGTTQFAPGKFLTLFIIHRLHNNLIIIRFFFSYARFPVQKRRAIFVKSNRYPLGTNRAVGVT